MANRRKPETIRALDEICRAIRHICIILHEAYEDSDVYFDEKTNCVYVSLYGHHWSNSFIGKIDTTGMDLKAITKAALEMALGFRVELEADD